MDKKRIIILAVLALAAIFVVVRGCKAPPRSKYAVERTVDAAIKAAASPQAGVSTVRRRAKKSAHAAWGRNPVAAPDVKGKTRGIAVEGILWYENSPRAIIGDAIVKIGDSVGNYTVVDIRKDRVILNDGQQDVEIGLKEE